jgi:transmembrane sensor
MERLQSLFQKYLDNNISVDEFTEMWQLLALEKQTGSLTPPLQQLWDQRSGYTLSDSHWDYEFKKLKHAQQPVSIKKMPAWRKYAAAAAILIIIAAVGHLSFNRSFNKNDVVKNNLPAKDIAAPTSTKATITLANGQTVLLDSMNSGILATQGNVNVTKTADGQIIYNGTTSETTYNTLTNPRGSTVVNLTLNDGTKVWLNSESSLRYPTAFAGSERKVEITGEGYFEVAHNAARPFFVKDVDRDVEVKVLGTHFNVNTYADEGAMKVTLLQGSVKVTKGSSTTLLKPGQQALVIEEVKIINDADLDEVMAWKNGRFEFNASTIETVMKDMARWYDVQVEYAGVRPTVHFMGGISRLENISEVLKMLEQTKAVHFKIEGKKIVVMK